MNFIMQPSVILNVFLNHCINFYNLHFHSDSSTIRKYFMVKYLTLSEVVQIVKP